MEYRLFGQVTRALIEASKTDLWDLSTRMDALDWNRRMWSALAEACASSDNQMPAPLRAQFISLSIWVSKYTSAVIRREDDIDALIDVNKMIMQGLAGDQAEAAA